MNALRLLWTALVIAFGPRVNATVARDRLHEATGYLVTRPRRAGATNALVPY